MFFTNRRVAGRRLAERLMRYRPFHPLILGVARGGVPVAHEVAKALATDFDVLVVRKIAAPTHPEIAVGAVAPGVTVFDGDAIAALDVRTDYLARMTAAQRAAVEDAVIRYRGDAPGLDLAQRTVIVVDDGVRTGATAAAALQAARRLGAAQAIVAVPVCAPATMRSLRHAADDLVYLNAPTDPRPLAYWFSDFPVVDDAEVRRLVEDAWTPQGADVAAEAIR